MAAAPSGGVRCQGSWLERQVTGSQRRQGQRWLAAAPSGEVPDRQGAHAGGMGTAQWPPVAAPPGEGPDRQGAHAGGMGTAQRPLAAAKQKDPRWQGSGPAGPPDWPSPRTL